MVASTKTREDIGDAAADESDTTADDGDWTTRPHGKGWYYKTDSEDESEENEVDTSSQRRTRSGRVFTAPFATNCATDFTALAATTDLASDHAQ